jgi:hypothetical protein
MFAISSFCFSTFFTWTVRFSKRANDWSEKYLSSGAKEVLVKSVLQSLPTYAMSVFKFSADLCDELEQLIRNFWWGDEHERRKIHWIAWDKIIKPKLRGGIGFRDLAFFNQALLAKQAWRLLQFSDSLCARLLKAQYFPHGNLLDTSFPANSSPTWKGIEHGLELLKKEPFGE